MGNDGDFSRLLKNIKVHIFSYLDPQSTASALQVCKQWHTLITNRQAELQKIWDTKAKKPELRLFLSHPLNVLFIQEKLAPLFPYQPLNLRPGENAEIRVEELSHDQNFLLNNLTQAIEAFPGCHNFLCRSFMNLSVYRDFEKVGLAARILKKVPALQDIFKNILASTEFNITRGDSPSTKNPKKSVDYSHVLQHKLVLKLLALSGDEKAQQHIRNFINMYSEDNSDGIIKTDNGYGFFFLSSFTDDSTLLETVLYNLEDFLESR